MTDNSAQEQRRVWLRKNQRPPKGCIFFMGWKGYCKADRGNHPNYCQDHRESVCWYEGCGKQARKSCAVQECQEVECYYHPHYEEH